MQGVSNVDNHITVMPDMHVTDSEANVEAALTPSDAVDISNIAMQVRGATVILYGTCPTHANGILPDR